MSSRFRCVEAALVNHLLARTARWPRAKLHDALSSPLPLSASHAVPSQRASSSYHNVPHLGPNTALVREDTSPPHSACAPRRSGQLVFNAASQFCRRRAQAHALRNMHIREALLPSSLRCMRMSAWSDGSGKMDFANVGGADARA